MSARQPRDVVMRCGVCGFQAGPNTPGMTAYSFRKHSCEWQQRKADRAARTAAARTASGEVRDCQHPRARHQHGTRAAYVLDRCRCRPCRDATAREQARVDRLKAYGQWEPYIDAEPARQHILTLSAKGMGWKRVQAASGVSNGALNRLMYGRNDRGPSKRIRRETAEAILAVKFDLDLVGDRALVDGVGTRRRLQALVAIGWSQSKLAALIGTSASYVGVMLRADAPVQAATARAVRDLYDRLWDQAPPQSNHRDRIAANRSRAMAARKGYLPPLAWDDDTIDDPAAWADLGSDDGDAVIDEVAVDRFIAGDIAWDAISTMDRLAAAIRMERLGYSRNEIAKRVRVNNRRLWATFEAGRPLTHTEAEQWASDRQEGAA